MSFGDMSCDYILQHLKQKVKPMSVTFACKAAAGAPGEGLRDIFMGETDPMFAVSRGEFEADSRARQPGAWNAERPTLSFTFRRLIFWQCTLL